MSPQESDAELRERLEQEAVAWLTQLTSGEATEAERTRFQAWYGQSPAHARAFDAVAALWHGLDTVLVPPPLRPSHRPWRRSWSLAALGALSALVLAAFFPDVLRRPFHDYGTAIGEQQSVRLRDGSPVHLNTDTTLDLDFSHGHRRLILNRGEAAFEVAKDRRPFRVEAGTVRTEALGTEFLLRYEGEAGIVTLIEGKVRITVAAPTPSPSRAAVSLAPGQQVGFSRTDLGPAQAARPSAAAAWRRGRLVMSFVPLGAVIAEINRYRRVPVSLIGTSLAEHRVNVAIDLAEVDVWVEALTRSLSLKAT
ncbi:MAG: FecR family protein [Gammaproteobacteria bacterium]